jgi:hypothetical protein
MRLPMETGWHRMNFALRFTHLTRWASILLALLVASASTNSLSRADDAVVHWTNGASQDAVQVLSNGEVFVTDFKGVNDVRVTVISGAIPDLYDEEFGGFAPGNNPDWITEFVGDPLKGTGDGTAGVWRMLEPSRSAAVLQFDFAMPLVAGDRMMIADVDNTEMYRIQAYAQAGSGGDFLPVSANGWLRENFSGQTGIPPDERWPVWTTDGYLTATGTALFEPLVVLTFDQRIDRITFTNPGDPAGTPAIQFVSPAGLPGDYNNNGTVDAADYVVWRNGGPLLNEVVTLGSVNAADYTAWRERFGNTKGSGAVGASQAGAVPEPGLGWLLLLAIAQWRARQR